MLNMDELVARLADKSELEDLVRGFAFRDQQRWNELADLFVPGAQMRISWFNGPVEDFIRASHAQACAGQVLVKHHIHTPRLTIDGKRALGDTDIIIMLRAPVGPAGTLVDVTSYARFSDRFEKVGCRWKIAARTGIYEKDRADPVEAGTRIAWSTCPAEASLFSAEYRAMALLMKEVGIDARFDAVLSGSPQARQLLAEQRAWLNQLAEPALQMAS